MRFPLALTTKIAAYIIDQKLRRTPKFATVLQLEPLHTCNLTCTGCGRIREYSTSLKDILPLEDCLGAAKECNAPMVSVCGGEPLIYPQIELLIKGLLDQKRIVYVCTNAMFMRKKMREWLASELRKPETGKHWKRSSPSWWPKDWFPIKMRPQSKIQIPKSQMLRSAPHAGCIGTCTSMGWSGRTI